MTKIQTNDTLRSLVSGMGDPGRDKSASVFFQHLFLDDMTLETAYRNSWVAAKVVNIPAMDALRKGRDWQADQKDITLIEKEERRLGFWTKLLETKIKARLYGGAALVIGTADGANYAEPFEFDKVKKGGIAYLTVMTRQTLSVAELDADVGSEWYDRPKSYFLMDARSKHFEVHPSRIVRQLGLPFPNPRTATGPSFGWSDSVLQRVYSEVLNAGTVPANVASLVFEANVDSIAIPDFMDSLADPEYETRLLNRLMLVNAGKSVSRSVIHDAEETYSRNTISFTGLPDVMKTFIQVVAGAADIPTTRFMQSSASGLNATGEGDMKDYQDVVSAIQTLEIEPEIYRLDEAIIRSALGARPDEIFYTWSPLEQMSEKDNAEIGLKNAQAAEIFQRTGLFTPEEMRKSVSNQLIENSFYPGLGEAMDETGNFEFDLGQNTTETPPVAAKLPVGIVATDAAPRTLYMRRDVLNGVEIAEWYRSQGVASVYAPESMHVTIVYSKSPIDWMKFGEPWDAEITVKPGGPRLNEKFGDVGDVLVLQFACDELEYQPHISISLQGSGVDMETVKPWQGKIVLGPEIYEVIASGDWRSLVTAS